MKATVIDFGVRLLLVAFLSMLLSICVAWHADREFVRFTKMDQSNVAPVLLFEYASTTTWTVWPAAFGFVLSIVVCYSVLLRMLRSYVGLLVPLASVRRHTNQTSTMGKCGTSSGRK